MAKLGQILQEIHRRSLWQTFVFYVLACIVVLEVTEAIALRRQLPNWFLLLAVTLLIIGFPVVMITAALQEGIPRLGRSDPTLRVDLRENLGEPRRLSRLRRLFTWRNAILGGAAAFTLWALIAAGWLVLADQLVVESPPAGEPAVETER